LHRSSNDVKNERLQGKEGMIAPIHYDPSRRDSTKRKVPVK
jgi:hypothetical protein